MLLVGEQNGAVAVEKYLVIPQNTELLCNSPSRNIYPEELKNRCSDT